MTHLKAGDIVKFEQEIFDEEVSRCASLTGDYNPLHMDQDFAAKLPFKKRIVHGMLTASLASRLVGMELASPGALWAEQSFRFMAPVFIGDRLVFLAEILQVSVAAGSIRVKIVVKRENETVLEGEGTVLLHYGK